jgi:hypothetical protein
MNCVMLSITRWPAQRGSEIILTTGMMLTRIVSGPAASLLARPVAHYINSQRDRLENMATALAECTKTKFSPYFPAADLDRVRIIECDPLPISGLPFRNLAH